LPPLDRPTNTLPPEHTFEAAFEEMANMVPPPAGGGRMPFPDVVSRVAYWSRWSKESDGWGDPWQRLKLEVCRPLTMGDITTWGIKMERDRRPENGPTKIEPDFWRRADFYPQLMLLDPVGIRSAGNGELGLIYSQIMFSREDVDKVWPLCQDGRRSPFHEIFASWRLRWDEEHKEPPNV
jgi:hypothetical protein